MSNEKWMFRIRSACGMLGMCLPWLALIGGALVKDKSEQWWHSISVTYYITPALVAVLTAAAIVLMCYDGYDLQDNLVTSLAGVFGMGVVLFPCSGYGHDRVGYFQLPENASNIVHLACAGLFFSLLAYNCIFLFTKHGEEQSSRKKIRNIIYLACGWGMVATGVLLAVLLFFLPGWIVMVCEIVLLQLFGVAWLTKGGLILPDKE